MTKLSDGSFGFGDDVARPGAAKLIEEIGEVLQILGKLIVNGGDTDYWGDRDLHKLFLEELGDLEATITFFKGQNFTKDDHLEILKRKYEKLAKYATWKGRREDKDFVTCERCKGLGTESDWHCGCGQFVYHVVDCGRAAPCCVACKGARRFPNE